MAAGSAFNIDTFTSKLTRGGALASLFECEFLATGEGVKGDLDDFRFLCTGVSLPASTITAATVTYMGRALSIPGGREVAQVTTSIYNDEFMEIRNYIESWMERLNSHRTNKRDSDMIGINSYTGTLEIQQLSKDGNKATKTYQFIQAWPASTSAIPMSWATNDIETFDIVWNFAYWTAKNQAGSLIAGSA